MLPKVSIACTAFNQVSFIEECLEGFLMQQTDFNFEIVIHDDCSTDGTREIIERYTEKFPEIFFPKFQSENQYSKGIRGMMARFNFPRCRGKYIALCEGDDYWTDPLKLQKQVDFLDNHPDYTFSMGRVMMLYQSTKKLLPKKEFADPLKHEYFTLEDYLKQPFSHTSTFLFRNEDQVMPGWTSEITAGDQSLVVILTGKKGKIKFHDDVFSVYRVNEKSVTQEHLIKMLENNFKMFRYWNKYLDYEFNSLIRSRLVENYILYYLFKPKFIRKLYKNYVVESVLHFFYRGVMAVKNSF